MLVQQLGVEDPFPIFLFSLHLKTSWYRILEVFTPQINQNISKLLAAVVSERRSRARLFSQMPPVELILKMHQRPGSTTAAVLFS